jgi:hypothetical protein
MRKNRFRKYRSLQWINKIVAFLLLVLTVFVIFFMLYPFNAESEIKTSSPKTENLILIATQQSYFKDSVTSILASKYREGNIPVQLIDISSLPQVDPEAYTAIVIIHMWQTWSAPEVVNEFLEHTKSERDKIIIMTTSNDGTYGPEGVDAITGASKINDAALYADKIFERTAVLLNKNN